MPFYGTRKAKTATFDRGEYEDSGFESEWLYCGTPQIPPNGDSINIEPITRKCICANIPGMLQQTETVPRWSSLSDL